MAEVKDIIIRKPTAAETAEAKSWPIWTCKISTFEWEYTETETCLILEGKVTIKAVDSEDSVSFGPGDYVIFPNGLKCLWQVKSAVKKHYNFS
jgi:uncharacterized protein